MNKTEIENRLNQITDKVVSTILVFREIARVEGNDYKEEELEEDKIRWEIARAYNEVNNLISTILAFAFEEYGVTDLDALSTLKKYFNNHSINQEKNKIMERAFINELEEVQNVMLASLVSEILE